MSYRVVWCALAVAAGAGLMDWSASPCRAYAGPVQVAGTDDDQTWPADFGLLDQSVRVDPVQRVARFHLVFTRPPDFGSVDEFDRPINSFQYEINPAFTGGPGDLLRDGVGDVQTVLRGDEIRFTPGRKGLRVRTARGDPDPDPASGGWGEVRGVVPLAIDQNEVDFSVAFDVLKEDRDGEFAYRVFTTQHGETTSSVEAIAVPIPSAAWIGGSTLLIAAGVQLWWRRRIRRAG